MTLHYLASGEYQQSLVFSFRVGRTTVCHIIKETCHAIWCALSETYLNPPPPPPKPTGLEKHCSQVFQRIEFSQLSWGP